MTGFPLIDCSVQALLGLGTCQIVNVLDDVVEKPEDDFYKLYILTNSLAKYFCISCETLKSIFSQVCPSRSMEDWRVVRD